MKRWALIESGMVVTVVESDTEPGVPGIWIETLDAAPGHTYSNGVFIAPTPVVNSKITQLAFLSRFTDAEAIDIDLASIGATQQAAAMRRYLNKVNAAKFIDLNRADTRAGVQAIEAAGLIGPGRALEILDNPVQPSEIP